MDGPSGRWRCIAGPEEGAPGGLQWKSAGRPLKRPVSLTFMENHLTAPAGKWRLFTANPETLSKNWKISALRVKVHSVSIRHHICRWKPGSRNDAFILPDPIAADRNLPAVIDRILQISAKKGFTVGDFFCGGSGVVAEKAFEYGCSSILCDISQDATDKTFKKAQHYVDSMTVK